MTFRRPTRRTSPIAPPRRPTGRVSPISEWPDPGFPDPADVSGPPAGSGGSYTERTYSAPGTILDQVIPVVYGSAKVSGYCAAWDTGSTYLDMAFIFCHGVQAALGSILINEEAIAGLGWVTAYHTFLGDGTGTKPTEMGFVDATTWARMTDFCMVTVRIRIKSANCPGSFQATAVPTGRKFASFQSPHTESNYTNLAEIAYDVLTDDVWKGLASTVAGIEAGGTWELFADHCDEVMGDSSKRYTFNGVISERDPDKVIDLVLRAGFASKYFSPDGKIQIWSEAPPPAITGTWTASASATLTGSGGDASNELEADDIVFAGATPAVVVSTTGTDTILLDRAVTITAEKVRLTSGVYIKAENWVQTPEGREVETGSIPDEVRVRYTLSDYWGSMMYPEEPTEDKRIELTAEACNNASMARRISETKINLLALQPFLWKAVADASAAGLEPGDVFFFDDDVLTFQPARVLPPVSQNKGGVVGLRFQSYSVVAVSDSTQADPSIPAQPTGYVSGNPAYFNDIRSVTTAGVDYSFMTVDGSDLIRLGDGTKPIFLDANDIIIQSDGAAIRATDETGQIILSYSVNTGTSPKTKRVYIGDPSTAATDVEIRAQERIHLKPGPSVWFTGAGISGVVFHPDTTTGIAATILDNGIIQAEGDVNSEYDLVQITATPEAIFGDSAIPCELVGSQTRPQYNSGDLALLSDTGGGGGSDTDAIHDNLANEITAITAKTSPVDADEFLIEDSAASFVKKSVTLANLSGYIESDLGGPFLPLAAGSGNPITGDLHIEGADLSLQNNRSIVLWNTALTTSYTGLFMNTSNSIIVGSSSLPTEVHGSTILLDNPVTIDGSLTLGGDLTAAGSYIDVNCDFYAEYGEYIGVKNSGGTRLRGFGCNSSGEIILGQSGTVLHAEEGLNLKNDDAIRGAKTGFATTYYDLIKMEATTNRTLIGNSTYPTELAGIQTYCNGLFRAQGNVWLEGGGDVQLENTAKLTCNNSSGSAQDVAYIDGSNNLIFGSTGQPMTWVEGAKLKFYGAGYSGTAGPPTTTQWSTAGSWGIHVDTNGSVYITYNSGGTMHYLAMGT